MSALYQAYTVVVRVARAGLYFKDFVDGALLQEELAAAIGFSSVEDLKFLLVAIFFACLDLG